MREFGCLEGGQILSSLCVIRDGRLLTLACRVAKRRGNQENAIWSRGKRGILQISIGGVVLAFKDLDDLYCQVSTAWIVFLKLCLQSKSCDDERRMELAEGIDRSYGC